LSQAIERGIALAEYAEQLLHEDPRWEVVTPAQLGIVTFAGRNATSEDHAAAAAALTADGYAAVTTTVSQGRSVLRLCTINPSDDRGGHRRHSGPPRRPKRSGMRIDRSTAHDQTTAPGRPDPL
jgi:glutamate/tyrosine decarboxylase-like PLP-dependent enzyme